MTVQRVSVPGGVALLADATAPATIKDVLAITGGQVPLIIADPPYGNIVDQEWDKTELLDAQFAAHMKAWTWAWREALLPGGAFYVWGGIGTPGFRPFFKYMAMAEVAGLFELANVITWKKKRAYGVQHNYLFTREECAYFCNGPAKSPRCFNVPLLDEKRGYAGFSEKYAAKSDYLRRSNVWADVTELLRGKVHPTQKAQRVIEIPIEVHTNSGEWVIDPFAGAGTTAHAARKLGRQFVVVENDPATFDGMVSRLRV